MVSDAAVAVSSLAATDSRTTELSPRHLPRQWVSEDKTGTDVDRKAAQQAKRLSKQSQFTRSRRTAHDNAFEEVVVAKYCPTFWMFQDRARAFYKDTKVEIGVAALILGNFLTNVIQATIDPQQDKYAALFDGIDVFFTSAFTFELMLNMYGSWFWAFWQSAWNVFDFVVVSIALLVSIKVPLPGPFTMLRMLRVFRVFRLFKRVRSLKKIMDSLARAIPGVINAFIILILVMCIYSILAVEFFSRAGSGGRIENELGVSIEYMTPRRQDYGMEYFGNFPKAMYTMFQVLTGESWSEAVVRPLLHSPNSLENVLIAAYFVSFVLIAAIILINVVVAVLLEKMVDSPEPEPYLDGSGSEDGGDDDDHTKVAPEAVPDKLSLHPTGRSAVPDKLSLHPNGRSVEQEVLVLRRDVDEVRQQLGQILHIVQDLHCRSTNGKGNASVSPAVTPASGINGHSSGNGCMCIEPPKAPHPHSLREETTASRSGQLARPAHTLRIE